MDSSPTGGTSLLTIIENALPRLPDGLRAIGRTILADPDTAVTLTVASLGLRSSTSPAAVTRFCQAIGLAGFHDLRLRLAREIGHETARRWHIDVGFDITPDDDLAHAVAMVTQAGLASVQRTTDKLDHPTAESAARSLATARRIDLYAIGTSALAATEMQLRLHGIGRPAWVHPDGRRAAISAALLGHGDTAIGICHSGDTPEIVSALRLARRNGATTVAITNEPHSALATAAQHTLTTFVYGTTFRHGEQAASHAQLLLLDCLYVRVAQLTHAHAADCLDPTAANRDQHRTPGAAGDTSPVATDCGESWAC
ncbi:transcriptional regulator [Longispora fulva]|nr:MurR/RpiR family transcriptional regulator [Longispora fulva]GIG62501.1 transcriptional regulator [Longispora fulva]